MLTNIPGTRGLLSPLVSETDLDFVESLKEAKYNVLITCLLTLLKNIHTVRRIKHVGLSYSSVLRSSFLVSSFLLEATL